jgi:hypothetical protein
MIIRSGSEKAVEIPRARISSPKNINCIMYIMFIPHQKIYKKSSD